MHGGRLMSLALDQVLELLLEANDDRVVSLFAVRLAVLRLRSVGHQESPQDKAAVVIGNRAPILQSENRAARTSLVEVDVGVVERRSPPEAARDASDRSLREHRLSGRNSVQGTKLVTGH